MCVCICSSQRWVSACSASHCSADVFCRLHCGQIQGDTAPTICWLTPPAASLCWSHSLTGTRNTNIYWCISCFVCSLFSVMRSFDTDLMSLWLGHVWDCNVTSWMMFQRSLSVWDFFSNTRHFHSGDRVDETLELVPAAFGNELDLLNQTIWSLLAASIGNSMHFFQTIWWWQAGCRVSSVGSKNCQSVLICNSLWK